MGLFDDIVYDHYYECEDKHTTIVEVNGNEKADDVVVCTCGKEACFKSFKAQQSIMIRTTFEKGGRLATRTSFANGKAMYMAETKRRTLEKGTSSSVYDKRFTEEVRKMEKKTNFTKPGEE